MERFLARMVDCRPPTCVLCVLGHEDKVHSSTWLQHKSQSLAEGKNFAWAVAGESELGFEDKDRGGLGSGGRVRRLGCEDKVRSWLGSGRRVRVRLGGEDKV